MSERKNASTLTREEAVEIGQRCRDYTNPLIQAFAGEMIKEGYPLSEGCTQLLLEAFDDETLGRKFARWCDEGEEAHVKRA